MFTSRVLMNTPDIIAGCRHLSALVSAALNASARHREVKKKTNIFKGEEMKNLNEFDVAAIAISWTGAGVVTWLASEAWVAAMAIAAGYYLSKWIILKTEKE
jgi:hypothetical protein